MSLWWEPSLIATSTSPIVASYDQIIFVGIFPIRVADPFHFDTDLDFWIRIVEKTDPEPDPTINRKNTKLFSSDYPRNDEY